ncbi:MAG: hypothetical protein E6I09_00750 [Chloroflexi bacterium]|nr:MAG: hypothetical protein E6I09_00750 [Chloroflexota bacterium]
MNVITTVAEMKAARERLNGTVALVPTMGYLHPFSVRAELVEASRPSRLLTSSPPSPRYRPSETV